jgi:hypothetical protein
MSVCGVDGRNKISSEQLTVKSFLLVKYSVMNGTVQSNWQCEDTEKP